MFVVIARYKIKKKYHKGFVKESRSFYLPKLGKARGFKRLLFMRNILDAEYIDVVIEWKDKSNFMNFIRKNPERPVFKIPHQVLERYLYETI